MFKLKISQISSTVYWYPDYCSCTKKWSFLVHILGPSNPPPLVVALWQTVGFILTCGGCWCIVKHYLKSLANFIYLSIFDPYGQLMLAPTFANPVVLLDHSYLLSILLYVCAYVHVYVCVLTRIISCDPTWCNNSKASSSWGETFFIALNLSSCCPGSYMW
jgi:hypothetical protein